MSAAAGLLWHRTPLLFAALPALSIAAKITHLQENPMKTGITSKNYKISVRPLPEAIQSTSVLGNIWREQRIYLKQDVEIV